jgi:hypothetical protein
MKYKNKLIAVSGLLFLTLSLLSFEKEKLNKLKVNRAQKILPVCLLLNGDQKGDMFFYMLAALKQKNIKTISKKDAEELCYLEMKSVYEDYYKSRKVENESFDDIKQKAMSQLTYVVNFLDVNLAIDSSANINLIDSVRLKVLPGPYNIGNPYKSNWVNIKSAKKEASLALCEELVDSILSKKLFFTEK